MYIWWSCLGTYESDSGHTFGRQLGGFAIGFNKRTTFGQDHALIESCELQAHWVEHHRNVSETYCALCLPSFHFNHFAGVPSSSYKLYNLVSIQSIKEITQI